MPSNQRSAGVRTVGALRRLLHLTCGFSGALACVFLFLTGALILSQVVARMLGGMVPSAIDLAAFCMAASTFLGLAYTFRDRAHIRVLLALHRLPHRGRRIAETFNFAAATLLFGYLAYMLGDMAWVSFDFGDMSIGLVPVPLWIPQTALTFGAGVATAVLFDETCSLVAGGSGRFNEVDLDANPGGPVSQEL